jgi:hypothetical protein
MFLFVIFKKKNKQKCTFFKQNLLCPFVKKKAKGLGQKTKFTKIFCPGCGNKKPLDLVLQKKGGRKKFYLKKNISLSHFFHFCLTQTQLCL